MIHILRAEDCIITDLEELKEYVSKIPETCFLNEVSTKFEDIENEIESVINKVVLYFESLKDARRD